MKNITVYDKSQRSFACTKLEFVVSSLEDERIAPSTVLNETGLSRLDLMDNSTLISLEQLLKCYKNAIQLTQDEFIGYKLGFKSHTPTLGALGFALLSAADIRQALNFIEQFYSLMSTAVTLIFKENQRTVSLTFNPAISINLDPMLYKFLSEYYVSGFYTIMLELIGEQFELESISYPYPQPQNSEIYTTRFHCQINYNAAEITINFNSRWLDHYNPKRNNATFFQLKSYCQKQSNELLLNQGMTGLIRKLYLSDPIKNWTLNDVCTLLNMSERTLRRRLKEEKTNFREIINALRQELALDYLKNSSLGIETIAFQLGYSCNFTFRQAIQRWTGMTPSQIRARYSNKNSV